MQRRVPLILILFLASAFVSQGRDSRPILADSITSHPLANASIFGCGGNMIGVSGPKGQFPYIAPGDYPVTVRYMGYKERVVVSADADTVYMQENVMELPEFVVDSREKIVLHILAYVREYSSLSTYTDTVFLFREKMVDFMLPTEEKMRFKGWRRPRILASKSYYRFSNSCGMDSVSDHCDNHFSWADWMGMPPFAELPPSMRVGEYATDTVWGKYSPAETWTRKGDRLTLDVNVIADNVGRRWVPNLSAFFNGDIDFEQFKVRLNYSNIIDSEVTPVDLTGYSYNIESNGRGLGMFKFNRVDESVYVTTYAEVYMLDKEFITVKEAKQWEQRRISDLDLNIYEPEEAPDLQPSIQKLVDRVNSIDKEGVRLGIAPDRRLAGRKVVKPNLGRDVLKRLKGMFGIDYAIGKRKMNNNWKKFRRERVRKNQSNYKEEE